MLCAWARSYFVEDRLIVLDGWNLRSSAGRAQQYRWLQFESSRGQVDLARTTVTFSPGDPTYDPSTRFPHHFEWSHNRKPRRFQPLGAEPKGVWAKMGFFYWHGVLPPRYTAPLRSWIFGLPYWSLTMAVAFFPCWRAAYTVRRRLRRRRLNLCSNCGYDWRFNQNCCPECGTAK